MAPTCIKHVSHRLDGTLDGRRDNFLILVISLFIGPLRGALAVCLPETVRGI